MCGTTRSSKGFPAILIRIKKEACKHWAYNQLAAIPIEDVLCLAWQDNKVVLAMSTLHKPQDRVLRLRSRIRKSSKNGEIIRRIFGMNIEN